ncbi:B-cell lymphoma 6 protein homolog isoform X2 [Fopius arisanus]|uniref:B-cell lymphoma 6 protein homolog isoform X2 n=1 Tax=Fopius arisanus TaxID=64838 RepID=A0A9R1TUN5_9HYME|nr:PREDICTED: B-cell lymphoma 6 protein homolog isoform X2 [Fopius arisanus]
MEYGIWSLHAASGLWGGDPRLVRRSASLVPPSGPPIIPRAGFSLHHPLDPSAYKALELTNPSHSINSDEARSETSTPLDTIKKSDDNESNIERNDEDEDNDYKNSPPTESNDNNNEDPDEESDTNTNTTTSSQRNNSPSEKSLDPMAYFGMDKDETITPSVLNGWVLSAYTAMLGRLSAATAAFEATEVPGMPSDNSDSDSDSSSYTERSRGESPVGGTCRGYPCGSCDVISSTRPALRKHILNSHPSNAEASDGDPRSCPSPGCNFTTINRCEMETHVANHMAQGTTSTGKKRSLALQRVRYEREEYRCTMCTYACTIEKAFQRHLRAHAKGSAPETRVSCAVCGADRSSEVDLSRHMRRHRDDRYFCCDICVFRTVQLKKLIQHRRMHTGEKPHLCPHCAYRSARRDNLRSHVRRVHKKENLYCDTFSPRGMLIAPIPSASSTPDAKISESPPPSSQHGLN